MHTGTLYQTTGPAFVGEAYPQNCGTKAELRNKTKTQKPPKPALPFLREG